MNIPWSGHPLYRLDHVSFILYLNGYVFGQRLLSFLILVLQVLVEQLNALIIVGFSNL